MATGTTKIITSQAPASAGVFLPGIESLAASYEAVIDDAQTNSRNFFFRNHSLLRDNRGTILAAGLDDTGNFVGLFDYPKVYDETLPSATRNMLLGLDASRWEKGEYAWEIYDGEIGHKQSVRQLYIGPDGMQALRQTYDHQGILQSTVAEEPAELWGTIKDWLEHDALDMHIEQRTGKRKRAEAHLVEFIGDSIEKYQPLKFLKLVDQLDASITKAGFSHGEPIRPKLPISTGWNEASKAVFLDRMAELRETNRKETEQKGLVVSEVVSKEEIKIESVDIDDTDSGPSPKSAQGVLIEV